MNFAPHPERRIAVVSGASAGIGAATARMLAAAGCPVAVAARRLDRCEALAAEIRQARGEAVGLVLDVTSDESVAAFGSAVRAELGEPEILVSNAGGLGMLHTLEATTTQIADDLDLHVLGAHRLAREFVPGMIERQRGDIVFVSSDSVGSPRPGVAPYITAKSGQDGLAASLRADLEGTGVRATIVRPGPTSTEIYHDWDADRFYEMWAVWQRWGIQRHDGLMAPEHVASAIVMAATAPRGMHLTDIEVQPEAPVRPR